MVTSDFVANHFKDEILCNHKITLKEKRKLCWLKLAMHVTVNLVQRENKRVMNEYNGVMNVDYARLWHYREELKLSNPGTIVEIQHGKTNHITNKKYFKSIYAHFEACKQGWKDGCKKIIGVDDCFLKSIHKRELICVIWRTWE